MKKRQYTYVPNRKIDAVTTENAVFGGDELLDGVYVKGRRKFKKGGEASKTKTPKQIAKSLMAIDSKVWDKLDITSGSALYGSDDMQKKYASELEKAGADKLMAEANKGVNRTSADTRVYQVMDILQDNNYHSLYNYFVYRGVYGDQKIKIYEDFYKEDMGKRGSSSFLNPALVSKNITVGYKHGGQTKAVPTRTLTLEEKALDIVGPTEWHGLDSEEKADLITEMVSDGVISIPYEYGGMMANGGRTADWGIYEPSMRESDGKFVVYSRSHGIMSFSSKEEAEDYINQIKDDLLQISMGLEDVTYAKGGVAEAAKYKVVFKMKGMDEKEKVFDDKGKAETFVEMMSDDEDIEKIKMEEVKEKVKKSAPKKAEATAPPVSLFGMAKAVTPAPTSSKKTAPQVAIPGIQDTIRRYDELHAMIKNAEAEKELLHGELVELGADKFMEMYERQGSRPKNFDMTDGGESILFMVSDAYEKMTPEKAAILEAYPGVLETEVKYSFNPEVLDRVGDVVSRLIMDSRLLSDDDKRNLLIVETKQFVRKGTIDRLMEYDDPRMLFDVIKPKKGLK